LLSNVGVSRVGRERAESVDPHACLATNVPGAGLCKLVIGLVRLGRLAVDRCAGTHDNRKVLIVSGDEAGADAVVVVRAVSGGL
jgi:hypothetical protein